MNNEPDKITPPEERLVEASTMETLRAEANQRTIDDVFRLFIVPEIERRQAAGVAPKR